MLADMKLDAQRRLTDYQREVSLAEKELLLAEKKLQKSKEYLERYMKTEYGRHMSAMDHTTRETMDATPVLRPSAAAFIRSSGAAGPVPLTPSLYGSESGGAELHDYKYVQLDREIRDDIRALLRSIQARDQMVSASRRAYQTLDRTNKATVMTVLGTFIEREREAQSAREMALVQLENAMFDYNAESDELSFIDAHTSDELCCIQSSHALTILGDFVTCVGGNSSWGSSNTPPASGALATPASPIIANNPKRNSLVSSAISYDQSNTDSKQLLKSPDQLSNEILDYLTRIFYMTNKHQLSSKYLNIILNSTSAADTVIRNEIPLEVLILCQEFKKCNTQLPDDSAYSVPLIEAVNEIADAVESNAGRDVFVTCLNQFRSRQVNVGISFGWLGAVLWTALDWCHSCSDIHSAKIIMMLSQTFYFKLSEIISTSTEHIAPAEDAEEVEEESRQTKDRTYIIALITTHPERR